MNISNERSNKTVKLRKTIKILNYPNHHYLRNICILNSRHYQSNYKCIFKQREKQLFYIVDAERIMFTISRKTKVSINYLTQYNIFQVLVADCK